MSDTERSTLALEIVSQALASYSGSRYYINTKDVGVSNRKTSMTTRMTWALGREPNGENPTNIVRNMMFGNCYMGHFDDDANNLANNSHPAASQRSSVGLSCIYTFVASSCLIDKNPHSLAKYRLPSWHTHPDLPSLIFRLFTGRWRWFYDIPRRASAFLLISRT